MQNIKTSFLEYLPIDFVENFVHTLSDGRISEIQWAVFDEYKNKALKYNLIHLRDKDSQEILLKFNQAVQALSKFLLPNFFDEKITSDDKIIFGLYPEWRHSPDPKIHGNWMNMHNQLFELTNNFGELYRQLVPIVTLEQSNALQGNIPIQHSKVVAHKKEQIRKITFLYCGKNYSDTKSYTHFVINDDNFKVNKISKSYGSSIRNLIQNYFSPNNNTVALKPKDYSELNGGRNAIYCNKSYAQTKIITKQNKTIFKINPKLEIEYEEYTKFLKKNTKLH